MNMTHYMELLATNQPWNLIIFMPIPVVLAETVAITERYVLYTRKLHGWEKDLNRVAGIVVGLSGRHTRLGTYDARWTYDEG